MCAEIPSSLRNPVTRLRLHLNWLPARAPCRFEQCFHDPGSHQRIFDGPCGDLLAEQTARESLNLEQVLIDFAEIEDRGRYRADTGIVPDLESAGDRAGLREWKIQSDPPGAAEHTKLLMCGPAGGSGLRRDGQRCMAVTVIEQG